MAERKRPRHEVVLVLLGDESQIDDFAFAAFGAFDVAGAGEDEFQV